MTTLQGSWPSWACPMCGWCIAVNDTEDYADLRVEAGKHAHIDLHCAEFAAEMDLANERL